MTNLFRSLARIVRRLVGRAPTIEYHGSGPGKAPRVWFKGKRVRSGTVRMTAEFRMAPGWKFSDAKPIVLLSDKLED